MKLIQLHEARKKGRTVTDVLISQAECDHIDSNKQGKFNPSKIGNPLKWLNSLVVNDFGTEFLELSSEDLTSLEGLPDHALDYGLRINYNPKLKSLEHLPVHITSEFQMRGLPLIKSLKGIHLALKSVPSIGLTASHIKSHVLGLTLIRGLSFIEDEENVEADWVTIVNKHLDEDSGDEERRAKMYACQSELIEADMKEYAQL